MAVIKLGQLLHRATTAPIDENNPLNVALSGTIREVIKAYYDARVYNNCAFGENRTFGTTVGSIPLDISGYKDVVILIHNIGENAQEISSIVGFVDNRILLPYASEKVVVASGARICIKDEDVLKYSTHIRVRFWKSGDPETVMNIVFLGVRL